MSLRKIYFPLVLLLLLQRFNAFSQERTINFTFYQNRKLSPGNKTYYINPKSGDDHNKGTSIKTAWKTFKNINDLILSGGDRLNVVAPGPFHESLALIAKGTESMPVNISFAPGTYDLFPDQAVKTQLNITNTNDVPYALKAIGLMFDSSSYVNVQAVKAKIILRGKMVETFVDHSDHIKITGLSFDYFRPTVSELKVTAVGNNYADLLVNKDSKFSVKDSVLTWLGEGWSCQPGFYWQMLDPKTNDLSKIDIQPGGNKYVFEGGNRLRVYFLKNPGFKVNFIYQNRDIVRDYASLFMRYSKNITLKNLHLFFMHGMGVVSEYCENILIDHVAVRPDESSGRTCAAWADILHFAGCRGTIEIANSYLSSANDDAINIHGIHLKIIAEPSANQLKVRFMHPQTYGFEAFAAGDSVDFINPKTLLADASGLVMQTRILNEKETLLAFKDPLPAGAVINDVIENISATPKIKIHDDTITRIPTRGILVTSRRKTIINNNLFLHTHNSGVLISDDGSKWFESGMVKDVTISDNTFYKCGEPAILIHPENSEEGKTPVHSNIHITDNTFNLNGKGLLSAKSTSNLVISGNRVTGTNTGATFLGLIRLDNCPGVKVFDNIVY